MFFLPCDTIIIKQKQGVGMKKVIGILAIVCICVLLGISVEYNRENDVSLIECGFS